jgi:transcriptional regulator with XRE-family HTH domain
MHTHVRRERLARAMSLKTLAAQIQMPLSTLAKKEVGTSPFTLPELLRIAAVFGLAVDALIVTDAPALDHDPGAHALGELYSAVDALGGL